MANIGTRKYFCRTFLGTLEPWLKDPQTDARNSVVDVLTEWHVLEEAGYPRAVTAGDFPEGYFVYKVASHVDDANDMDVVASLLTRVALHGTHVIVRMQGDEIGKLTINDVNKLADYAFVVRDIANWADPEARERARWAADQLLGLR